MVGSLGLGYGLAALSGALFALSYPGVGIWPACFVSFVPLLAAIDGCARSGGQAAALGLTSGVVAQLLTCHWAFGALHAFGALPWALCVPIGALLCAYQGGQFALCSLLLWGAKRRGWDVAWVAPFALPAVEWAYPLLFPSYAAAGLQRWTLLLQLAELGGPLLLSMLVMGMNAGLYGALRAMRAGPGGTVAAGSLLRSLLIALGLLAVALGYGRLRVTQIEARIAGAPTLTLGIVQANLGPFRRREDRSLWRLRHIEQSKQLEQARPKPDLLIWPETALHYPLPVDVKSVRQLLGPLATPVLFGGLAHDAARAELFNSAYLADAEGRVLARSDKLRLIPFAEYVPGSRQLPLLAEWLPNSGQFTAGSRANALPFRGHRIAALNCYEELLPGLVSDIVEQTDPELLVSLGNHVWFGRSTETYSHQALASLRAIEHRRYLVRANNSGVSSVIDAAGRIVTQSRWGERQNLRATVALLDEPTWFERLGDAAGWLGMAVTLVAAVWRRPGRPVRPPYA